MISNSPNQTRYHIIFISHLYEKWGDTTCMRVCVCARACTYVHTHTHTHKQNIHFSPWYFLINRNKMTVITYDKLMTTRICWPHRQYTKAQTDATTYLSWCFTVTELHGGGSDQQVGSTELQYGRQKQAYNFHKYQRCWWLPSAQFFCMYDDLTLVSWKLS